MYVYNVKQKPASSMSTYTRMSTITRSGSEFRKALASGCSKSLGPLGVLVSKKRLNQASTKKATRKVFLKNFEKIDPFLRNSSQTVGFSLIKEVCNDFYQNCGQKQLLGFPKNHFFPRVCKISTVVLIILYIIKKFMFKLHFLPGLHTNKAILSVQVLVPNGYSFQLLGTPLHAL